MKTKNIIDFYKYCLSATASRVQSALTTKKVTKSMEGVVKVSNT